MYCPNCGSKDIKIIRWETCMTCGCTFKILNVLEKSKGERVTIDTFIKANSDNLE